MHAKFNDHGLINQCLTRVVNQEKYAIRLIELKLDTQTSGGDRSGDRSGVNVNTLLSLLPVYGLDDSIIKKHSIGSNGLVYNLYPNTSNDWEKLEKMFSPDQYWRLICKIPTKLKRSDETEIKLTVGGSTVLDDGGRRISDSEMLFPALIELTGIDISYAKDLKEEAVKRSNYNEYVKNYRKYGPRWG